MIASFLAVGANLVFVNLFIGPFQHKAIAMATSGAMICNFLFLGVVLYKKVQGYSLSYLGESLIKIFVATGFMGVWVWLVYGWLESLFSGGVLLQIAGLVAVITSAAWVYGVMLYVFRVKELALVVDRIKARVLH